MRRSVSTSLKTKLATLASHLYAGTCRWLELVGELDRRGDWAESGRASCAEWLAWRCALTPRAAREHVRVARRLAELPQIHAAFAHGELSYAKVRALTRVARPRPSRSSRAGSGLHRRSAGARCARLPAGDDRGGLRAAGRRVLERVLGAGRLARHPRPARTRGRGAAPTGPRCDARARTGSKHAAVPRNRGRRARPRTRRRSSRSRKPRWRTRRAAVRAASGTRSSSTPTRPCSRATARAAASSRTGARSRPRRRAGSPATRRVVRNGRKTRTIPPALRRALHARDRGCRFPGCENLRFLDAHHVQHWAKGGETTADNLVLLCRRHHRLVHEGGWHVDRRARFTNRWGQAFPAVPSLPRGHPDELVARNRGLAIVAGPASPARGTPSTWPPPSTRYSRGRCVRRPGVTCEDTPSGH